MALLSSCKNDAFIYAPWDDECLSHHDLLSLALVRRYFLPHGHASVYRTAYDHSDLKLARKRFYLYKLTLPGEGLDEVIQARGDTLITVNFARRTGLRISSIQYDSLSTKMAKISFQYDLQGLLPGLERNTETVKTFATLAKDEEGNWSRLPIDPSWQQETSRLPFTRRRRDVLLKKQVFDERNVLIRGNLFSTPAQ